MQGFFSPQQSETAGHPGSWQEVPLRCSFFALQLLRKRSSPEAGGREAALETIRIMRIARSKLLWVAENQPRDRRGNAPGRLAFPWDEGMQLAKSEKSLLPATSGFVPAMMPCE